MMEQQQARWRKSTKSGAHSDCIEVRGDLGAVRDSKTPRGPVLAGDAAELVAAVKAGRFDG